MTYAGAAALVLWLLIVLFGWALCRVAARADEAGARAFDPYREYP